ncbi:trichohyalin-like [Capsella rubella]|uniref:trichohyalin-like n=1 Tax=Capsella rubella TaxID=81985 RepID=UPI000CD57251|nr:trichohyalin-like [Capsella rubella]
MADAGGNQKEDERRSDETESRSTEEPKENEVLGLGTNERTGRIYYYSESHQEVLQYLREERLKDAEKQRRSHETESSSIEKTMGPTPVMGLSDSGRRSDGRTDSIQNITGSSSLPSTSMAGARDNEKEPVRRSDQEPDSTRIRQENEEIGRVYYYSESHQEVLQYLREERLKDAEKQRRIHGIESRSIKETIVKQEHSNADTRETLQQYHRRLRDEEMQQYHRRLRDEEMQRRRRETESRFWHRERDRSPGRRGSDSRLRFDERAQGWRGSHESRWRFDERPQGWRGSHESRWRFDERAQRRYEMDYSGFRPEERLLAHPQSGFIPDSRVSDPKGHDTEWSFERGRMEQIEWQRREPQYNLQEQRSRGEVRENSHMRGIMRQRREGQVREQRQRREAQETLRQQEMLENRNLDARDHQNTKQLGFKRNEGDGV